MIILMKFLIKWYNMDVIFFNKLFHNMYVSISRWNRMLNQSIGSIISFDVNFKGIQEWNVLNTTVSSSVFFLFQSAKIQ